MNIVPLEMFGYEAPAQVHQHHPRLEVVCMADVRPSAIDWLWQNWIALGKVHVLAGEGGRGKSTILCNTTAITTTGTKWPDGAEARKPAGVIILAAEDDVEDTLAPRLMAAGADLSRVFVIRSVFDENRRRYRNAPTVEGVLRGDLPQPPTTNFPPSANRNAPVKVAPALARGGLPQEGQPQPAAGGGDRPGSLIGFL